MKSRLVRILAIAVSGCLSAAVARPAATVLTPVPEVEPNNGPGSANSINLVGGCQAVSGSIAPTGDLDYYTFTAPAGAKLWAGVDTGPSSTGRDSILTLFGADGSTAIESDDDDGIGNDCDATIESTQASAIAGRTLTAGGTYFLRVESFAGDPISAYKLFVVVTTTSTPESEPNDSAATANSLVTALSPIGVRTAAIGTAGDADYYSVVVTAPATLFVSGDADPEKNGGTDIVVQLISTNGTTVLFTADNSSDLGLPDPPAESFCFTIATPGTYFVRVSGFAGGKAPVTGTYSLMVAVCGLPTPTPTPTATTVAGGPTATPTRTSTTGPATATPTRTSTPIGGIAPSDIPTLSFPMLLLMGLALVASAFVLVRRL